MVKSKKLELMVGDSAKIKDGLLSETEIIYAGMPNESTYSIIFSKSCGYQAWSYNLYFPEEKKSFELGKKKQNRFNVIYQDSDKIIMEHIV